MMGMHDCKEKDSLKRLTRRKTLGVRREQKLRVEKTDDFKGFSDLAEYF